MEVEVKGDIVYYPGCMALNVYPGVTKSSLEVLKLLGINVRLPKSVLCCGLPIEILGIAKSSQISSILRFNIAKLMGNPDYIIVPCNGCYMMLRKALGDVTIKAPQELKSRCIHIAEVLWSKRHQLAKMAKLDLSKLKVAVHIGCHYSYAFHKDVIRGEEGEDILEDIALAFNAEIVDYEEKHSCCGAPAVKWSGNIMLELSQRKITSIIDNGADMVLTMCPACMLMLDRTQYELRQLEEIERAIPILHVAQLVALALGFDAKKIAGIHLHYSSQEVSMPFLSSNA